MEGIEQLGSRVDAARLRSQNDEQLELRGGEIDCIGTAHDGPLYKVDLDVRGTDDVGSHLAAGTPQYRLDPRNELPRAERLDHIVVGAQLQTDDSVGLVRSCRQHHDRSRGMGADRSRDEVAETFLVLCHSLILGLS